MDHTDGLGGFLRSRRSRLSPLDVGLPPGTRARRVPGLRREEVAWLAGVSRDYYTRLEQGRHPGVSDAVLDAIARVLLLDTVERDYLHELARKTGHRRTKGAVQPVQRVRSALHQMIGVLGDVSPVLVVNHRRDVLAANRLARALFPDFEVLPYRERNLARFILLDPAARELYRNWADVAQSYVANLRLAAATHPDDRRLSELIGELSAQAPEFGAWWDAHQIDQCAHGDQHFRHAVGDLTLHHETLPLPSDPGQELCLFTAEPDSPSAETLRLLASWTAPDRAEGTLDEDAR